MVDASKRIIILSTTLLFLLCHVPVIEGSLAKIPEVTDLVEWSDLIITGNVTHIRPDEYGGFYMDVTVEIEAYYMGSPNSSAVVVRVDGENYASTVPDASFSMGERVLVFLRLSGGVYRVAGGPFGKFPVIEGSPYPLNRVKEIISNSTDIPVEQVGTTITKPETDEDPKGEVAIINDKVEPNYTLGIYGIVGIIVISFLYFSGEQIISVFKNRTRS